MLELKKKKLWSFRRQDMNKKISGERMETVAPIEEGRKIERNEEEEKELKNEDEMVSNIAYKIMQSKMMKKDFIGERGFNKLIPPFKEVIENRG